MSFIYGLTFVRPPQADPGAISARAADYASLSIAATLAGSQVTAAVSTVASANEGTTTEAFLDHTQGPGSVADHMSDLSAAAQRTSTAYTTAAVAVATTRTAMDATAKSYELPFLKAGLIPILGRGRQAMIVAEARAALKALDAAGATQVNAAFATINLPSPFAVEYYSSFPPEIEEAWDNLTDQEKRDLLQLLSDQHADRLGIPRVELEFVNDPGGSLGVRKGDGTVEMNEAYFDDPTMLGVAVHETQHVAQYIYIDEYEEIANDPDYLDDILAGRVDDPMQEQYGISTADAQRLAEGNQGHVRDKGYWERPVEIDARRSGDRFTDDLTIQELEDLIDQI